MTDVERVYVMIVDEVDIAFRELQGKYRSDSPHVTFANACELVKIRGQRELAVQIFKLQQGLKP